MKKVRGKPMVTVEVSDEDGVVWALRFFEIEKGLFESAFMPSLKIHPQHAEYVAWLTAVAVHDGFKAMGLENMRYEYMRERVHQVLSKPEDEE